MISFFIGTRTIILKARANKTEINFMIFILFFVKNCLYASIQKIRIHTVKYLPIS